MERTVFIEQLIFEAMIKRFAGRRSRHDQHLLLCDAEFSQRFRERWIGFEIGEVNVFFHSVVTFHFARRGSVLAQLGGRKGARYDHARRQTKRQMISRLMFVIHQRYRLNSQGRGGGNLRVRIVTDREIEPAIACPLS